MLALYVDKWKDVYDTAALTRTLRASRRREAPAPTLGICSISGSVMIIQAQFLRTLLVSDGDPGAFFGRPFAGIVLPATPPALIVPVERGGVRRIRGLGGQD